MRPAFQMGFVGAIIGTRTIWRRRRTPRCTTASVARMFEALAKDYEEHARQMRGPNGSGGEHVTVELREPRTAESRAADAAETLRQPAIAAR